VALQRRAVHAIQLGSASQPTCHCAQLAVAVCVQLEDQEPGDDVAVPSISRQLLKLLQPSSQDEHQVMLLY
jgi:hypothetical protein